MQRKILVVDDSDVNRRILRKILSGEYEVLEAENGRAALDVLYPAGDVVSAVLLDLTMPVMDGYELLTRMRADAGLSQIPVIVTTITADTDVEVRALSLGANDFITKPYSPQVIRHRLWNTINLRETAAIVNTATKDRLTGLYNRDAFFLKSAEMIAARDPGYYVLACLDIDNFKVINDLYGSARGDDVLRHIANVFQRGISEAGGICCRVTADDFAGLYPRALLESDQMDTMRREASQIEGIRPITISTGRYLVTDKSLSISAMYDRAKIAQASVKGRFDTHVAEFAESMRGQILQDQEIISEMNAALMGKQFEIWFQPQYNHASGALIGAEALVRWRHPQRGMISPGAFIPVFERNGFIYELDKFVWEEACAALRRWIDMGLAPLPISVNISRYDVVRGDLISVITGLIEEYRVPVELLRLEITESAFAKSTEEIISVVKKLVDYGFTMEIDDFGSGYSSLNALKDVPAQVLKLDMRFLKNDSNSDQSSLRGGNILESIVRMAKWLGMSVIAEGVEAVEQANFLKSVGCQYVQGYLYARPMPMGEYEALLCGEGRREKKLLALETAANLDNNSFWDPRSMDTLIFNSYVGGAGIFEYRQGTMELLRANDKYARVFGGEAMTIERVLRLNWERYLDDENRAALDAALEDSIRTGEETTRELLFVNLPGCSRETYLRTTLRVIAVAGERYLVYCTHENITAQREAERKEQAAERMRAEASEQLQAIMNGVHGGVTAVKVSDEGLSRFIFSNNDYYTMLGYTREQFASEVASAFDLIHPDDRARVTSNIRQLIRACACAALEFRARKRGGEYIYVRVNASVTAIKGIEDNVLLCITTDITQLVRAEQKVASASEQLRAIMSGINGGLSAVYMWEGAPRFLFANERYYGQLGYTREQFEAEVDNAFSLIYPGDRARVSEETLRASEEKTPFTTLFRAVCRSGDVRWHRSSISIVHIPGIDAPVQLAVASDVTEQVEAEAGERRLSGQLRAIMNNMESGVLACEIISGAAHTLFANDCFYSLFGYTRAQYEGEIADAFALVHPDDRAGVSRAFREAAESGAPARTAFRALCRDGGTRWIRASVSTAPTAQGEPPAYFSVLNDITSEHDAAEKLGEMNLQHELLNHSAHELLSGDDVEAAIQRALEALRAYFEGTRAYLLEFGGDTRTPPGAREACAPGVAPAMAGGTQPSATSARLWMRAFGGRKYLWLSDDETLGCAGPEARAEARARGAESLIAVPLWRDGQLIGAMGVDNPVRRQEFMERMCALGEYMAAALLRRDLRARITSDQEMLETLMNDTPGGFARVTISGGRVAAPRYVNDGFCAMLNMPRADVLADMNKSIMNLMHPDDREHFYECVCQAARGDGRMEARLRIRRGDGEWIRVNAFGRVTRGENGERYLNLYFARMPEMEKTRLGSLDALPPALRAMMDSTEDIAFVKDKDLKYVCASRSFLRMAGAERLADVQGRTDYELFPRAIADRFREDDMRLIESGKPRVDMVEPIPSGDAAPHYSSTVKHLLRDAEGNTAGILGVGRDISEYRAAFEELKLLSDNVPGGLAKFECQSGDVRALYVSQGVCDVLGYARDALCARSHGERQTLLHPDDARLLRERIARMREDGAPIDIVCRVFKNDGETCYIHARGAISARMGDSIFVNALLLDVTEARRSEEETRLVNQLIDDCSAAVYVCDAETYELYYLNRNAARMCGKTVEEARGQTCYRYLKNADRPCRPCYIQDAREDAYTERVYSSPPSGKHYMTRGKLIRWNGRRALAEYLTDETERVNAQKNLRDLVDGIPIGIGIYRYYPDGRLEMAYMNDGYYAMIGAKREARARYAGVAALEAAHPDDVPGLMERLGAILREPRVACCDIRVMNGEGRYMWLGVKARLAYRTDEFAVLYAAYSDIDAEKKALLQLEAARRVLEMANREARISLWLYDLKAKRITGELLTERSPLGHPSAKERVPESSVENGDVHPEDAGAYLGMYHQLFSGDMRSECTVRVRNLHTGKYEWQHIAYSRLFDPYFEGSIAVGVAANVDSQQETLQRYEHETRLRHEMVKDAQIYYELNLTTNAIEEYRATAPNMPRMRVSTPVDAQLDEEILSGIAPEDRERVRGTLFADALREAYGRGETAMELEYRRRAPGRGLYWLRANATIVKRPGANELIAFVYARDITREKHRRQALDSILTEEIECVCLLNVQNNRARILDIGAKLDGTAGEADFEYDAFIERLSSTSVAPEDREAFLAHFRLENLTAALKRAPSASMTFRTRLATGELLRKRALAFYIDESREIIALARRDITGLYEEEQRQKQALQKAVREATEASRAKSDFLSRMSHDMRTPLNAVIGMVALAQEEENPAATVEYLRNIDESSHLLLGLISDILDLGKIESGKMELREGPFMLEEFLRSIDTVIKPLMESRGVEFEYRMGCGAENIHVDKVRFTQIFFNLLSNAAKYTPEGGRVEFTAEHIPDDARGRHGMRFYVRDTGCGMSEDFIKVAFDPFTQERPSANARGQGSGLGLAIVKKMVDAMGGDIRVKSALGEGTEFTVDLYAYMESEITADESALKTEDIDLTGMRVLLVEDIAINALVARKLLEKKGCMADVAENGLVGVKRFTDSPPGHYQAILMDIRMPVMDGFEAARRVRESGRADSASVPIIAMTADALIEDQARTRQAGMNAHISKPIDPGLLYRTLYEFLREGNQCDA